MWGSKMTTLNNKPVGCGYSYNESGDKVDDHLHDISEEPPGLSLSGIETLKKMGYSMADILKDFKVDASNVKKMFMLNKG